MSRRGYALLASVVILLGGCGSDGGVSVESPPASPATTPATVPVTESLPSTTASTVPAVVDEAAVEACLSTAGLVVTPDAMLLSGVAGIGVNPAGETDTSGFPVVILVFGSEEQAVAERDFLQQTFPGEFVVSGSILVWLAAATGEFRQQVLDCTVGLAG